jgi:hypothetical protein
VPGCAIGSSPGLEHGPLIVTEWPAVNVAAGGPTLELVVGVVLGSVAGPLPWTISIGSDLRWSVWTVLPSCTTIWSGAFTLGDFGAGVVELPVLHPASPAQIAAAARAPVNLLPMPASLLLPTIGFFGPKRAASDVPVDGP